MDNNNNKFDMDGLDDEFTLESILAEYKGDAYIEGDKKTPPEKLQEDADRIIAEVTGRAPAPRNTVPEKKPVKPSEPPAVRAQTPDSAEDEADRPVVFKSAVKKAEAPHVEAETFDDDEVSAEISDFFDKMEYGDRKLRTDVKREVEDAIGEEEFAEKRAKRGVVLNIFSRKNRLEDYDGYDDDYDEPEDGCDSGEYEDYDEDYVAEDEEPDYQEKAQEYASRLKLMGVRQGAALVICAIMAYITFGYDRGWIMLSGISYVKAVTFLGVLLICVMALCYDVIVDGIMDIFIGRMGGETLASVSAIVSIVDVFIIVRNGGAERGLPFCTVAACSLFFSLWGRKLYYNAMKLALRTACMTSEPRVVSTEHDIASGRSLVQKYSRDISGFYNRIAGVDCCESAYSVAAPLLILASLIFAALCSVLKGNPENLLMCFSALLAISGSFSAGLAYVLPFSKVTKRVTAIGAAVSGWTGASAIAAADGAIITDTDIFPDGTLSVSGVKIVEGANAKKVISYTGSLIMASGSGLSGTFEELLKAQACKAVHVDNFSCYDGGGIGSVINGERVLVGSFGFMNLMGIRLPQNLSVKTAVFTAVNDELCGIFSVNYVPVNSVQDGLVVLLKNKVKTLTAVRDFNMTPLMIQQKFKISVDSIEYISLQDSFRILNKEPEGAVSAVLGRDGMSSYAEAVVGGKLLRRTAFVSTVISVVGAALGLLIMFMLCWTGAFEAVSADNMLAFMLLWTVPVLLISGISNKY